VDCFFRLFVGVQDFVLRVRHLQAATGSTFDRPKEHDALAPLQDVAHEGLIQPDRANCPAGVADQRFEDFEAGTPGRPKATVDDLAGKRRPLAGFQALNGTETATIFIPKGKSLEQIFHRLQPDPLQV
jgi:hypothetical protein